MAAIPTERRTKPRLSLRLPVELLLPDSQRVTGLTRDVSLSGVYFVVSKGFNPADEVRFLLAFPPEITFSETKKVRCTGKVVRVDEETPTRAGIAVAISSHELVDKADINYPFAMVRTPSTR